MRILALPVDDAVANDYNNTGPQEKKVINSAVNLLLEKILKEKQNVALFNLMTELSDTAAQNGLTIEKLGELMEWDQQTMKNLFGDTYATHAG